ncbi:hypothetical protein DINM_005828 [Dirofilaria immitis]|nr:hypothetical protein [Dirofilaria immitis]
MTVLGNNHYKSRKVRIIKVVKDQRKPKGSGGYGYQRWHSGSGTRKCRRRRITFGVQTLAGNVENIQHAVDPIFEHISYMVNYESEKLIAGKWGKPIVLLWMERIADLFNHWPWKKPEITLAKEYGLAQRCPRSTIRRLKSPELLERYDEYFKNLLEKTNEGLSLNERLYKETAIKHGITMFNKNPFTSQAKTLSGDN